MPIFLREIRTFFSASEACFWARARFSSPTSMFLSSS